MSKTKVRDNSNGPAIRSSLQYGALCYRVRDNEVQFLLITTRNSGKWMIPKGWPISGLSPHETAAQEAFEEAGVDGKIRPKAIGVYLHHPSPGRGFRKRDVVIFPLRVKKTLKLFPEVGQRRRKWLGRKKAAKKVANAQLAQLIRDFRPKRMGKA